MYRKKGWSEAGNKAEVVRIIITERRKVCFIISTTYCVLLYRSQVHVH